MNAYKGVKNNDAPIPPNDLAIIDKIIKFLISWTKTNVPNAVKLNP